MSETERTGPHDCEQLVAILEVLETECELPLLLDAHLLTCPLETGPIEARKSP